jgi:hypothetical protein
MLRNILFAGRAVDADQLKKTLKLHLQGLAGILDTQRNTIHRRHQGLEQILILPPALPPAP